ncbi:MAG: PASTA domain-containing protein [Deinococcales bacterium]
MSLLDGKYEIISQTAVDRGRTLIEATAPDGTLVRIEWFELEPVKEQAFERYRRVLKRLKRTGKAAVYDVISRPGAHYVAWESVGDGLARARDDEIDAVLLENGFDAASADVRRNGRSARLYGLTWDGGAPVQQHAVQPEPAPHKPAPRRGLPGRLAPWGLTLLLIVASLALMAGGFLRRTNNRTVQVPNVVGQNVNDAQRALARLDLAANPTPLESPSPAGTVLSVQPAAGTELRPGRTVQLSYALPQGQLASTKVPQLVGETFPGQVSTALQQAGLELGTIARIHASTPAGVVLAQSAPSGSKLAKGQAVNVLISVGPVGQQTFLPKLVGLTVDDAKYLAQVAGLAPDQILVDKVDAPDGYPGEVLSQSLAPYLPEPVDQAILRLVVEQGAAAGSQQPATVPSLVGMSLDQATTVATGYTISTTTVESPLLPEGVVLQSPAPGADPGDHKLALTVNVHPVTLTDPGAVATVKQPTLRHVPYAWTIQPGIPQQVATVYAKPLNGQRTLVDRTTVQGGQLLQGTWLTTYPGPVTFTLELNGQPYGSPLFVP